METVVGDLVEAMVVNREQWRLRALVKTQLVVFVVKDGSEATASSDTDKTHSYGTFFGDCLEPARRLGFFTV